MKQLNLVALINAILGGFILILSIQVHATAVSFPLLDAAPNGTPVNNDIDNLDGCTAIPAGDYVLDSSGVVFHIGQICSVNDLLSIGPSGWRVRGYCTNYPPNTPCNGFAPAFLVKIPTCPSGYSNSNGTCNPNGTPIPNKNPDSGGCIGNPISAGLGAKMQSESDFNSPTLPALIFQRNYNSSPPDYLSGTDAKKYWSHNFERKLIIKNNQGSAATVLVVRPRAQLLYFSFINNGWNTDSDLSDKLTELKDGTGTRTGWTYSVDTTGEVEAYDATGKLLSIADRAGNIQTMTYSDSNTAISVAPVAGLLVKVTDNVGHSLNFTYDSNGRLYTMTDPSGGTYTYAYSTDGNNNLASVTYPDGKVKSYLYGEATYVSASPNNGVSYANALTGIIDESGKRFATWNYDSAGRAVSSEHAVGIEKSYLVYSVDTNGNPTTTVVTEPNGTARTYNFTTVLGVVKSTGQNQPAGSGCNASASNLTYDSNGNVAIRTDFSGHTTRFTYDLTRNLELSRTEGLDSAGNATSATRTITTTWHPTWRLPLVERTYAGDTSTGTPIKTITHVYDSHDNITTYSEADPVNNISRTVTTTYTYSTVVNGLVLSKVVDGARTDVSDLTTYHYYDANATCAASISNPSVTNLGCRGQLQTMTDALGHVTSYDRYTPNGQLEQMTDANSVVTTMLYDARQRMTSRTVAAGTALAAATQYQYDNVGQFIKLTRPDASFTTYTYDDAHRLTDIGDTLGNSVHYTLNEDSSIAKTEYLNADGTTAKRDTFNYDALHRLETAYDANGHASAYGYDPNGNLTSQTDARNHTTTYTPDTLDRTKAIVDANSNTTQASYNALDQAVLVKTPNNAQTSFTIDNLGNIKQEQSADRGIRNATYDNAGNLLTLSDGRGVVTTATWDALNRPLTTSYPQTGENKTYTWDTGSGCTNGISRLCQIADAGGITSFSYDARGNLLTEQRTENGTAFTTTYAYDGADHLITTQTPTSRNLVTQRNTNGEIQQVNATSNNGTTTINTALVSNIKTNALGQTTNQSFANNVVENYTFNLSGYLSKLNSTGSTSNSGGNSGSGNTTGDADVPTLPEWGAILMAGLLMLINARRQTAQPSHNSNRWFLINFLVLGISVFNPISINKSYADTTLQYDENNNVIQRTTPSGTTTYGYDNLDRINSEAGASKTQTMQYDANGNRMSDTNTTSSNSYGYTPNTDRLVSMNGQAITLDAAGNTTSARGYTYTWNQAGQLKEVKLGTGTNAVLLATYTYDYKNRRSRKVTTSAAPQGATTTIYIYDQVDHLIAEMKAPNTPLYTYVWKDDMPVSVIIHQAAQQAANPTQTITSTADQIIYLEVDHLNTPRLGRNQSNVVVWSWDSDAFGSTIANGDPDGDNFKTIVNLRFAGQYYDQESGLHYNYNRYYDPQSGGRYLSADPIGLEGGLNLYGYANASPLKFTDPNGQAVVFPRLFPLILPTIPMPSGSKDDGSFGGLFPSGTMSPSHAGSDKGCEPDDFCYKRWEQEDFRCGRWRNLGNRAIAACKTRASDRRNLCISNGGKPNPEEPPEYNPFLDYPR